MTAGASSDTPKKTLLELSLHPSAIAGLLVVVAVLVLNGEQFLEHERKLLWPVTKWFLLAVVASAALFYHLTEILQETTQEFSLALKDAPRSEFWIRVASQVALLVSADMLVHEHWIGFVVAFLLFFSLLLLWDCVVWTHLPTSVGTASRMDILTKDGFALMSAICIITCILIWTATDPACASDLANCTREQIDELNATERNINVMAVAGTTPIIYCALSTAQTAIRRWRSDRAS